MPYSQLHATCSVCRVTIRQQNLRRHQLRHHPSFVHVQSSGADEARASVTSAASDTQPPALVGDVLSDGLSLEGLFTVEDAIPTPKIIEEATICMLSRRHAYTELELMEFLAAKYPTIPDFMRQPIVVAATTAARHAAAMQHVYLTNKDSRDPALRNDATNAASILSYWGLGLRVREPCTLPASSTAPMAPMIVDADVANNVLATTLLSYLPRTHDVHIDSMPVVQLGGAVPLLDDALITQLPPPMTPIPECSATVTENLLLTRQMPVPLQPSPSTPSSATPADANVTNSTDGPESHHRKLQSIVDMPLTLTASPQPSIEEEEVISRKPVNDKENRPPFVKDKDKEHSARDRQRSTCLDRRQLPEERVRPDLIRKRKPSSSDKTADEDRHRRGVSPFVRRPIPHAFHRVTSTSANDRRPWHDQNKRRYY